MACGTPDSRVVDTRCYDGEAVLRRRVCECGARWTTREVPVARTLTAVSTADAVRPQRPPASPVHTHVATSPPLDIATNSQPLVVAEVGKTGFLPLASPSGDPDLDQIRIPEAIASGRLKPPKRKSTKAVATAKPRQDPRVGEIYSLFRPLWQAMYRTSWVPEPGVANNVTAMLRVLDEAGGVEVADIGEWLERYFADVGRYVIESRHALRLFCSQFQKYRAHAPKVGALSERDKGNAAALAAFLGRPR